ncbi:hypothetical protein AJ85_18080 [Alkalihalobacillus alcalophilus ATCC 27647 = CGMCC 1.3604]|uniref:WYL domain-containing protein n=1 Tax=Alkalihalobacillus alcalophilus ATCC 27647 = CGMCC 1.3604 TaxID=1218173 RepID=A0A094YQY4_ALKAL|nr:hypothetical protein BALCAV_0219675 [Alkalihalobacillus alcalophilus ATCC 27647 = CGMCC 1.3604]THG89375.1 hypothetical protein AJ85_18080 [Alkalihalobacillus alcalophilus ATCC 27647 = CGMCC 1.3604]
MKYEQVQYSSQQRVLDIYNRLLAGESINVSNLSAEYGKHTETIKEDIRHIRFVIEQQYNSILYDAKNNTYSIEKSNDFLMSGDILILLILLYQSRSLIKEERILIEEKLINLFTLEERRKLKKFFRSYNYHYSPSQRNEIRGKINDLFHAILEQKQILFLYSKNNGLKERKVKPLTINFHDYQFYLVAEFVGKEYKTPVNFRIDKIEKITILEERFEINHTNDFF